jgi:hypothetical protein
MLTRPGQRLRPATTLCRDCLGAFRAPQCTLLEYTNSSSFDWAGISIRRTRLGKPGGLGDQRPGGNGPISSTPRTARRCRQSWPPSAASRGRLGAIVRLHFQNAEPDDQSPFAGPSGPAAEELRRSSSTPAHRATASGSWAPALQPRGVPSSVSRPVPGDRTPLSRHAFSTCRSGDSSWTGTATRTDMGLKFRRGSSPSRPGSPERCFPPGKY